MPERLLCEDGLRVSIDGGGERTLIVVSGPDTVRFWTQTALLEAALQGDRVQLSSYGGYCQIDVEKDRVRLSYGSEKGGRMRCEFSKELFSAALAWVRSLEEPHGPTSSDSS